jgi:hypothetical protein
MMLAEGPTSVETEPNDTQDAPQAMTLPLTLSGRFDRPRDADWYAFDVPENAAFAFDVYCERIAGRADPYLVVVDDMGNRVNEFDDFGIRTNAFDGHLRDPSGTLNLAGPRRYRLLVQDRYGRGGPQYQYVLTVRRTAPDFHVAAIHAENPGPSSTTVWRGGSAWMDLIVHRRDGGNMPVTISAENLPPCLHAAPTTIDSDSRGVLVLWADADAPEYSGPIELLARGPRLHASDPAADPAAPPLVRQVRPYTRVWAQANIGSSRPTRQHAVAIRDQAPYGLAIEPAQITVTAGQPTELRLVVTRHWPDFTDKVRAIPLAFPGNFQMAEFDAPAGQA